LLTAGTIKMETLFDSLSGPLGTFLSAMLPVGELRLAIPLGIIHFDMPWYQALFYGVLGNLVPVIPLLLGLKLAARILTSFSNPLGRFLLWREGKIRSSYGARFQRYGALALLPFVAIPLPLTGAWTGCLAAWAFEVPPRKAFPVIAVGVILAGVVVTALVQLSVDFPFLRNFN